MNLETDRKYAQEKAFDNLTEEIQRYAQTMNYKCMCCGAGTNEFVRVYLCDTHIKKYEDIFSHERTTSREGRFNEGGS